MTISFTEEASAAQDEAARLAERAAKRAGEGNYDKAISIWKRVLELNPSLHKARRDLAMACMESGDTESAKNHLIEVLRLNPGDAWGWVVLGNLYAKNQKEWTTAEKFLRRALEIAPNDPWALNGIATMTAQRGQTDEAVKLFEQAIAANPDVPNPYYGLGVTFHRTGKPDLAARALDRLFFSARTQDVRAKQVFDQARTLYGTVQDDLMKQQHPDAFKAVENLAGRTGAVVRLPGAHNRGRVQGQDLGHDPDGMETRARPSPDKGPTLFAGRFADTPDGARVEPPATGGGSPESVGKNRFFVTTMPPSKCPPARRRRHPQTGA